MCVRLLMLVENFYFSKMSSFTEGTSLHGAAKKPKLTANISGPGYVLQVSHVN